MLATVEMLRDGAVHPRLFRRRSTHISNYQGGPLFGFMCGRMVISYGYGSGIRLGDVHQSNDFNSGNGSQQTATAREFSLPPYPITMSTAAGRTS
jgi:hypothetical protein